MTANLNKKKVQYNMVFDLHIYVVKLKSNLTFGMKGKKRGYPHIQSVAKRISVCLLNQ